MSKIIYNDEQLKQKQFEDVSNDVIEEIDARQENAKVYYPYFEIYRKLKSRQERCFRYFAPIKHSSRQR